MSSALEPVFALADAVIDHPSKLLLVAQANLLFTFTLFSVFIHNRALFSSFGFDPRLATSGPAGGPQPIVIGFMLYQLVFEPMDTVVKFLMNSQTRKYEYQAGELAADVLPPSPPKLTSS